VALPGLGLESQLVIPRRALTEIRDVPFTSKGFAFAGLLFEDAAGE
jgi:hypothetical protein